MWHDERDDFFAMKYMVSYTPQLPIPNIQTAHIYFSVRTLTRQRFLQIQGAVSLCNEFCIHSKLIAIVAEGEFPHMTLARQELGWVEQTRITSQKIPALPRTLEGEGVTDVVFQRRTNEARGAQLFG